MRRFLSGVLRAGPVLTLALALAICAAGLVSAAGPPAPSRVTVGPGLSMYGDLKYGPGFRHFDYVRPDAPKGGDVRFSALGTFDSLNPYILKGVPAVGIGALFDTLTVSSADEPFSEYGLIAETVELPAHRAWVAFTLRQEARFHDGSPITPEDVIWTFDALRAKGRPFYRAYYAKVAAVEKVGPRKVRFVFSPGDNRELALIVGQLPVLSKAYWSTRQFDRTTLEAPLGSGPYRVEAVEPGRSITYRLVKDYWGARLPVNVGRNNFERIRYDYYRDSTVAIEAFKAGSYDLRPENVSKLWAIGYEGPALRQGLIKKEEIPNEIPTGLQGFVYNTRRPIFADRRVRQALGYAFDFEWTNAHLFYGAYARTVSYFSNSELASRGLPGADELAVLDPFRGKVPEEVFTREYRPLSTDGSGYNRKGVIEALALLKEAGWVVRDMRLVNSRTGEPMRFEILLDEPGYERMTLPFAKNLERLGITARVRTVDTAQYQYRLDHFDFDMVMKVWGQSLSPGNEQREFWGSERASAPGSQNLAGVRDPVVDRLIELVVEAPDRASLVARTRALDRVLLWGHYVIPHYHIQNFRVAYWDKFGRPAVAPKYSLGLDTWWVEPGKVARVQSRQAGSR